MRCGSKGQGKTLSASPPFLPCSSLSWLLTVLGFIPNLPSPSPRLYWMRAKRPESASVALTLRMTVPNGTSSKTAFCKQREQAGLAVSSLMLLAGNNQGHRGHPGLGTAGPRTRFHTFRVHWLVGHLLHMVQAQAEGREGDPGESPSSMPDFTRQALLSPTLTWTGDPSSPGRMAG